MHVILCNADAMLSCVWSRNKKTMTTPFLRLRPHVYVFKFMGFNLTGNASKLLRPHERFCIVFACLHDNAENDRRDN